MGDGIYKTENIINGVYKIRNIINNNFYVGSCSSKGGFKERWRKHIQTLNDNKHYNSYLQNAWNKYGENNFEFSVLEKCFPGKCLSREQFYLDTLHPKYNLYKIAGSPLGRKLSDSSKNKISISLKGHLMSENTKKKISMALKGKLKSENHKNKVKSILWGKNGKLRLKFGGGRFSGYYVFFNIITKEKIKCAKFELADKYNIDRSFVYRMCNGKSSSCKGWVCLRKVERK